MEKTFNITELKANKSTVVDCIVIPAWILDTILLLCYKEVEYSGYLLCHKNIVEYPFLSGSGAVGSVFPNKKITFNSPDYKAIEFHTHTAALGEFWNNKFSNGDLTTFNNRIKQEGEGYKHVLFTTGNILTWGKKVAPDVRIGFGNYQLQMDRFYEINDKHHCWKPLAPNI